MNASGLDASHDPRREVEKLRESLGSHDKPLAFLIGAGASTAALGVDGKAMVPAMAELAPRCADAVKTLGSKEEAAYEAVSSQLKEKLGRDATVEDLLSSVREKVSAMAKGDVLSGATRAQLEGIEAAIRQTIAAAAMPDEDRFPGELPHRGVGRWLTRIERKVAVEIFTTNYDTLLERGLEQERATIFDGFVGSRRPFFSPPSLLHPEAAPARNWTRLWKIHGSINWSWESNPIKGRRIVRGPEVGDGELIFPSVHKYDESRKQPYVAILEHLRRVLNRPDEPLLVTSGYSFGDEHINEVIFDALEARDRTHVVALQYRELADDNDLMVAARRHHNLLVYGPKSAVVGGQRAQWRLGEPVTERTKDLLDIPFDSDAADPEGKEGTWTGIFRLGDFAKLARFLDTIGGADG